MPAIFFDGCWSTIIPIYVIDMFSSEKPILYIYASSMLTIVSGSVLITLEFDKLCAKYTQLKLARFYVPVVFFCSGLLILSQAHSYPVLIAAIFLFIVGEILLMPSYEELVKICTQHDLKLASGQYLGALGLIDGSIRFLSAGISLTIYGYFRGQVFLTWYWTLIISIFIIITFGSITFYVLNRKYLFRIMLYTQSDSTHWF